MNGFYWTPDLTQNSETPTQIPASYEISLTRIWGITISSKRPCLKTEHSFITKRKKAMLISSSHWPCYTAQLLAVWFQKCYVQVVKVFWSAHVAYSNYGFSIIMQVSRCKERCCQNWYKCRIMIYVSSYSTTQNIWMCWGRAIFLKEHCNYWGQFSCVNAMKGAFIRHSFHACNEQHYWPRHASWGWESEGETELVVKEFLKNIENSSMKPKLHRTRTNESCLGWFLNL